MSFEAASSSGAKEWPAPTAFGRNVARVSMRCADILEVAFSDDEIARLIDCPKVVTKRPRGEFLIHGRHRRNDFEMAAVEGADRFAVFMRQSMEFLENFSVGLDYFSPPDGARLCLIRCNGPHGEHRDIPGTPGHHFACHIHVASAEAMETGLRAESHAQITDQFATFEEAIAYFIRRCSILEPESLFRFVQSELSRQRELFEDEDG